MTRRRRKRRRTWWIPPQGSKRNVPRQTAQSTRRDWMSVTTGGRAKTRRQRPALRKFLTSTTASTIAQQKRFLSMSSRVDSVIGLSQELGAIIFGEVCSPVFHLQPV